METHYVKAPVSHSLPGSHLAADGNYRRSTEKLINKYPSLQYPDPNRNHAPDRSTAQRVARFDFGHTPAERTEFRTSESIRNHLDAHTDRLQQLEAGTLRELNVLESLDPDYVAVLGEELQVDPNVFVRHERTGQWQYKHEGREISTLPSSLEGTCSFTLEYRELLQLDEKSEFAYFNAKTTENERNVSHVKTDGRWTHVAIVQCKVSFWARRLKANGWQGKKTHLEASLCRIEPRSKWDFVFRFSHSRSASSQGLGPCKEWTSLEADKIAQKAPYQGGYADIVPFTNLEEVLKTNGPPRTSMYADLCYYFEHHQGLLPLTNHPRSVTAFLEQIVAAHHIRLLGYNRGIFDHLEKCFSDLRGDHAGSEVEKWHESSWNDLLLFSRRCKFESNTIESINFQLQSMGKGEDKTIQTRNADFAYLEKQAGHLRHKSEALIATSTSLATLIGTKPTLKENQRKIKESTSIFRLTVLGATFLPLSFTSSLFSMSKDYEPGSSKFWVYWVVAIGIIAVLLPPILFRFTTKAKGNDQIQGPWKFQFESLAPK